MQIYSIKWLITIGAAGLISTTRVAKLMKFLSSDNDKLKLAKMAYGYVIDRDSYDKIINKTFSSNNTKVYLNEYGSIHGVPTTFWKVFFFNFFSLNMPVWSRKHFWWKKIGSFLSNISRSRSFFKYMSNIVKIMQNISGKNKNISRNNSLGDFSRWKRWKHFRKKIREEESLLY